MNADQLKLERDGAIAIGEDSAILAHNGTKPAAVEKFAKKNWAAQIIPDEEYSIIVSRSYRSMLARLRHFRGVRVARGENGDLVAIG